MSIFPGLGSDGGRINSIYVLVAAGRLSIAVELFQNLGYEAAGPSVAVEQVIMRWGRLASRVVLKEVNLSSGGPYKIISVEVKDKRLTLISVKAWAEDKKITVISDDSSWVILDILDVSLHFTD